MLWINCWNFRLNEPFMKEILQIELINSTSSSLKVFYFSFITKHFSFVFRVLFWNKSFSDKFYTQSYCMHSIWNVNENYVNPQFSANSSVLEQKNHIHSWLDHSTNWIEIRRKLHISSCNLFSCNGIKGKQCLHSGDMV